MVDCIHTISSNPHIQVDFLRQYAYEYAYVYVLEINVFMYVLTFRCDGVMVYMYQCRYTSAFMRQVNPIKSHSVYSSCYICTCCLRHIFTCILRTLHSDSGFNSGGTVLHICEPFFEKYDWLRDYTHIPLSYNLGFIFVVLINFISLEVTVISKKVRGKVREKAVCTQLR